MCGITGTFNFGDVGLLRAMTQSIAHRGPDGEYLYGDGPVHLGNRRLAILDPEHGAQPMFNESGSVAVIYNGEIYNYPELRQHLLSSGHTLKTRCDTELLPHLYEEEGIDFVQRLNGIFAFALWDRDLNKLFLVRDPLGVKPLVFAQVGDRLAFGSEAKAVLASRLVAAELDEVSLHLTMNLRYIPGERTLFRGIRRLPPGTILEVDRAGLRSREYGTIDWSPRTRSLGDWIEAIRAHVEQAVHRQLLSDVPLGVSLSGGIDSSGLVAMIRKRYSGPLKTFTLGFNEPWDENEDARFVAERFGTEHHEIVLHEPAMGYLKEAIYFTEEPKVNCLQLFLLHRFVSEHVKVALSGLGGDELFGGYDFYTYLGRLRWLREVLPRGFSRRVLGPALDRLARMTARLDRPSLDLYVRGLEWVGCLHDGARHYLLLRNAWDFNPVLLQRVYTRDFLDRLEVRCRDGFDGFFPAERAVESEALRAEFRTKLVNDLLHNEDTMSMAHSVESRVPLLDLELVRFAAHIPDELRFRGGLKWLLKRAFKGIVPDETLAKKKWGFTVDPVEQYKKDLRAMAAELLTPDRLRRTGIFNPRFVTSLLSSRPHPRLRWHYFMLWQMIGVELWHELFLEHDPAGVDGTGP
ncbi:MAG: asparagine synthase (glutamine-hydrolyzing) [Gemmatimonadota bacterium]|nr:MAG: asparagine synthase (glutamine-hydrolyzing) [Gemmatimonadota bacterium]